MTELEARNVPEAPGPTSAQRLWRRFGRYMTEIFYRRYEVTGLDNLPREGSVILCANHVNALVDALVVQASCPRPIHPLARSGLFRNPLLRPLLEAIQAIPIYRRRSPPLESPRGDKASGSPRGDKISAANEDSFRRLYEILEDGRVILIFPEGQSHSDPMLRPLKTGAARIALGLEERGCALPVVVPVGLTFPDKGRFRSELLVQYGEPIRLEALEDEAGESEDLGGSKGGEDSEVRVRRLTEAILDGLRKVTLNVDCWEDLELLRLLQHFFLLRHGRRRGDLLRIGALADDPQEGGDPVPTLAQRFRSLQRLVTVHRWLRLTRPAEVRILTDKLRRFEELCRRYGVQDYHLNLIYRPALVARFMTRSVLFALLVFPVVLWGVVNSALPYFLTRLMTRWAARARDQYDSAGMLFGTGFFLLFWSAQTWAVQTFVGTAPAVAYASSLPATAGLALLMGHERRRILENVRVFFLFWRKRQLQDFLRLRRQELEIDLAKMARYARDGIHEPS